MVQPWFDVDVVESASATPVADLTVATGRALASPLGSAGLADLAAEAIRRGPAARAIIGVTDLTRASPDAVLVPPLLDELNRGGIPDERITVIVAIGLHRATTEAEKREKLGGAVDRVRVVDSDGRDPAKWADLGTIEPYGVPGFTQKLIKEAELVVAPGIVEPHQYAGYSGGPKTVASGCAGEPTITATHGMRILEEPRVGRPTSVLPRSRWSGRAALSSSRRASKKERARGAGSSAFSRLSSVPRRRPPSSKKRASIAPAVSSARSWSR